MFYNFLFPQYFRGKGISLVLLLLRLVFGVLFLFHGLDKLVDFNELSQTYPSVFGFGSYVTLMISIFCEFACSMFLIAGCLTRIVLLPMIVAMGVAFFDIHDAIMPEGELALIYFIVFIGLFFSGPGRYSVDYLIDEKIDTEWMLYQRDYTEEAAHNSMETRLNRDGMEESASISELERDVDKYPTYPIKELLKKPVYTKIRYK